MSDDFHIDIVESPSDYQQMVEQCRKHYLRARATESVLNNLKEAVGGSFVGLVFQKDGEWFKLVEASCGFVAVRIPEAP